MNDDQQEQQWPPTERPYWEDCEFDRDCTIRGRLMGYVPPEPGYKAGANASIYEEKFKEKIVPKSEWMALYEELQPNQNRLATVTYDQNGYGTCTSNATAQAMAYQWCRRYGHQWAVTPAPPSIYPFCARSGNSGSSTNCNIRRATQNGMLLIDNPQNRKVLRTLGLNEDHVIDAVQWNAGKRVPDSYYEETGKHFKIGEWYEITTVEGMFSAVLSGYTVLYGRSGHAICGVDPDPKNGWTLIYHNSWGNWGRSINGRSGYGEDSFRYLSRTGAARGAFAVRDVIEPPNIERLMEAS